MVESATRGVSSAMTEKVNRVNSLNPSMTRFWSLPHQLTEQRWLNLYLG